MDKYVISFFFLVSFLHLAHAQKKEVWVEAADHAFALEQDYYKAFKYYETALKYEKDTSDVLRLLYRKAESARLISAYYDARDAYLELTSRAPADSMAKSPYRCVWAYLGELQLNLAYPGNALFDPTPYKKALEYFDAYQDLSIAAPGDCDNLVSSGRDLIKFATSSVGMQLSNEPIEVKSAGSNINSRFSDFAPMSWGQRLYFTSFRQEIRGKEVQPTRYFSRIYVSNQGGTAQALQGIKLSPEDTLHVGHTTLNSAHDRIYFTLCEYANGTLNTRCDLYYHQLDKDGNLIGDRIEVSELNLKNSTLTQPAMAWDPGTRREVLFFASDRPGTRGGMDIWKSELVNDHFSTPTNDLVINTTGNEMTPFYRDGLLYFSSDGLPDRYGGYDIFFTTDPKTTKPVNLGQKINSSADDLYYSRNEEGNLAYFSSNRLAITSSELVNGKPDYLKEASSLDIYYYQIQDVPSTLTVSTFTSCAGPNDDGPQSLEGASITLFDITDGEDMDGRPRIEPISATGNHYQFANVLYPNRKYLIIGSREGFEVQQQQLDFSGIRRPGVDGPEKVELYFHCAVPLLQVQVYHHNQEVREAVVRIAAIPSNTQDDKESSTKETVESFQIPCTAGHDLYASYPNEKKIKAFSGEFPLEFEQTYLIIVDSGLPDSLRLGSTTYLASRSTEAFCRMACRDTLRIELETLPRIQLYFENSSPGPDPYDVSSSSYLMTLDRYKTRKAVYLEQLQTDNELSLNVTQRAELEQFFGNQLDSSHLVLYEFAQQATELLCQNVPITIEAKGCIPPELSIQTRKQVEYIRHLVNRRVESVQQDLIGLGLSTERWSDLYDFESLSEACELSSEASNIANEEWQNRQNSKPPRFSINAALARRVELKLKIGLGTEN